MSSRADRARQYFYEGYNCSQAVALAFCDLLELSPEQAARMASLFGGGFSRLREMCGTVSAAALVYGSVCGYSEPNNQKLKADCYKKMRDLCEKFKQQNGSFICGELLGTGKADAGGEPEARTPEYYKKRPCPDLVYSAAKILEEALLEEAVLSTEKSN